MAMTAEQLAKARAKRDVKEIAQLILDKPMGETGELKDIGDITSMETLMSSNVDVKTRIMMRMAGEAMNGDIKAAEFIMKYSGNEPAKEANINVNIPTFIDDMANLDDDLKITVKKKRKKSKTDEPPVYVVE